MALDFECASMLEERDLKIDLLALSLVAMIVFLTLSLVTYNPSDPIGELVFPLDRLHLTDSTVYPLADEISNACGQSGALVSQLLFTTIGLGAFYLLVSLIVLDGLLLMRRPISTPLLRMVGWGVSLLGFTTLVAMLLPSWSLGPVIGSGGYIGALARAALETRFAAAGAGILATTLVVGGLLLCTDYTLVRMSLCVMRWTLRIVGWFGRMLLHQSARSAEASAKAKLKRAAKKANQEEEEDDETMAVRIRGRRSKSDVDEMEDELADEVEDDEVEDEEEEAEVEETEEEEGGEEEEKKDSYLSRLRIRRRKGKKDAEKSEREAVMEQLDAAQTSDAGDYELPSLELLREADECCFEAQEKEVRQKAKILEKTFANFGFNIKVVEIETGPVIAQYEVELEAGLRLSRITGLADDLAIALRVPSVRIVAPIPGKNTVGIEVPNSVRQMVRLREVIEETDGRTKKMQIPIFLGKDVSGNPLVMDLASLPHLLIAGRTGTGKSVCLNAIISSMLMTKRPDEVRMLMIDPKMVELSCYKTLPHLMHPVVTDMRKAEAILAWAVDKMEQRYRLLARAGVRHLSVYNQLGEEELMERLDLESEAERDAIPSYLPYIVIVADEIADLMMTAGKDVEQHIIRLAQKSRAVGIHLILATQKPTVDVITGLIKSNLPARIAFQVASRTDSRVVLDEMGADRLLGNGDMLFLSPGTSTLLRGQGTFLSDGEIDSIVDAVSTGEQNFVKELIQLKVEEEEDEKPGPLKNRDALYEDAVNVVVREGRGSVSLLQRALGIGYGRAARLIDFMAEDGIVGNYAGSQAREVLITADDWSAMQAGDGDGGDSGEESGDDAAPTKTKTAKLKKPKKRRRSNKVIPLSRIEEEEEEAEEIIEDDGEVVVLEVADEEDVYEAEYDDEGEIDVEAEEELDDEEYEEIEYEDEEYDEEEYEDEEAEYEDDGYEYEYEDEEVETVSVRAKRTKV